MYGKPKAHEMLMLVSLLKFYDAKRWCDVTKLSCIIVLVIDQKNENNQVLQPHSIVLASFCWQTNIKASCD